MNAYQAVSPMMETSECVSTRHTFRMLTYDKHADSSDFDQK